MKQARCATVIVAACLLSGCATMRVSSHTEHGSLDGVVDDQRWMEETIDKSIDRILTRFPR